MLKRAQQRTSPIWLDWAGHRPSTAPTISTPSSSSRRLLRYSAFTTWFSGLSFNSIIYSSTHPLQLTESLRTITWRFGRGSVGSIALQSCCPISLGKSQVWIQSINSFQRWLRVTESETNAHHLSIHFSAVLLAIIVEKSKKCLDFSVTLFLIHLFSCIWYSGLPMKLDWWIVHILGTIVMILVGEYLCSLKELSDIPLLELWDQQGTSTQQGDNDHSFLLWWLGLKPAFTHCFQGNGWECTIAREAMQHILQGDSGENEVTTKFTFTLIKSDEFRLSSLRSNSHDTDT